MSRPFSRKPIGFQSYHKSVFLVDKKQQSLNCELCHIFDSQELEVLDHQASFQRNSTRNCLKLQDFSSNNKSKKSLKSQAKLTDFFSKTVISTHQPNQQYSSQAQQKVANSTDQFSRNVSKKLSKTTSSLPAHKFIQLPAESYSKVSSFGRQSFQNSFQNMNTSFHRIQYQNSVYPLSQKLIHIPLIESINKRSSQRLDSFGVRFSGEVKSAVNPQAFNFNKIKYVASVSQNLSSLPISPVKQIIIPQETERSGLNSHNQTDREISGVNINKMQFQAPPALKKNVSQEYSDFLRTTQNKGSSVLYKSDMVQKKTYGYNQPSIRIQKQQQVKKQQNERDFLQISFQEQKEQKNLQLESSQKTSEQNQNKVITTSNMFMKKIQLQQIQHNTFGEQVHSDSNKPQQSQTIERNVETAVKAPRMHHLPFGRYSVQIPKSKKFSNLKMRRTISMKDQQDSSSQETSQVIYGFRQTHKEPIMEDIAEDMMESCLAGTEQRFDAATMKNFRQLLN